MPRQRQTCRNTALFWRAQGERVICPQPALVESEDMHHFGAGPAAIERSAVRCELEAVEAFGHRGPGCNGKGQQVDNGDFLLAVAAVEDGGISAARMHGDVGWEIAQTNLPPCWMEGPLVGEKHRAVGAR